MQRSPYLRRPEGRLHLRRRCRWRGEEGSSSRSALREGKRERERQSMVDANASLCSLFTPLSCLFLLASLRSIRPSLLALSTDMIMEAREAERGRERTGFVMSLTTLSTRLSFDLLSLSTFFTNSCFLRFRLRLRAPRPGDGKEPRRSRPVVFAPLGAPASQPVCDRQVRFFLLFFHLFPFVFGFFPALSFSLKNASSLSLSFSSKTFLSLCLSVALPARTTQ